MKEEKKQQIYKLMLCTSSENFQLDQMNEEAAELLQAINKYKRAKIFSPDKVEECIEHLAEEMADVENLLNQMKYIFQNAELVEEYKTRKLKRIVKRIKARQGEKI